MEKLVESLKRNVKLAFKTVTFHFKEYLCFYVALVIIETLFGIIVMSASNNVKNITNETETEYNYHICLTGLSASKADYFLDPDGLRAGERLGVNKALNDDPIVEPRISNGKTVYDLYYRFESDPTEHLTDLGQLRQRFYRVYGDGLRNVNVTFSPLFFLNDNIAEVKADCALWLVLLAVVSCIILILLYNIRINHFKFTYGIYMSFGADCKRLFATCFWEVLVISVLTLIPSVLISTVADTLFYTLAGYSYSLSPWLALLAVFFIVPVVLVAVYVPVKATAIKPPLKLLLAEDNSNLVVSPRLSFQMFGTKFPTSYERFGLWRFRKYNIQLVFSAVLFSALFVLTSYYGTVYKYTVETEKEEYTINFPQHAVEYEEEEEVLKDVHNEFYELMVKVDIDKKATPTETARYEEMKVDLQNFIDKKEPVKFIFGDYDPLHDDYTTIKEITYETVKKTRMEGDTYTEKMREELLGISGVTSLYKYCNVSAFDLDSHVLFDTSDTTLDSGFLIHPKDGGLSVTNSVSYHSADDEILKYIKEFYDFTGNPDEILEKGNTVIISDCLANSKVLKIKPGDTIKVAKAVEIPTYTGNADEMVDDLYLSFLLENGTFEYETYTVCAVIKDIPTNHGIPLFFSSEDYESVTGKEPIYNGVSVYINQKLGKEAVQDITSEIRSWAEQYSDTSVIWHNALTESKAERSMRKLPLFNTIAVMLLIISPLFWFFSQIMFYKKREKEFELLRGMGAIESEIKKIFIYDGAFMALFGVIVMSVLSAAGIFAIYTFTLKLLPYISDGMKLKFIFRFPVVPAIISVVVTALCGFISAYIPYLSEKKNSEKTVSAEFGE